MKKILTLLLSTFGILCSLVCFADEKTEQIKKVQNAISKEEFEIRVDMIYPQAGPAIDSDGTYSLKISGGKATSYLPFFGESHTAIIAGVDETGIKFEDKSVQLKIEKKAKKKDTKYEISFSVDANSDRYDFFVEIWDEGQASISCSSLNRSPMSYSGKIWFKEE